MLKKLRLELRKMPNLSFLLTVCGTLFFATLYLEYLAPKWLQVQVVNEGVFLSLIFFAVAVGCLIKSVHDRKRSRDGIKSSFNCLHLVKVSKR